MTNDVQKNPYTPHLAKIGNPAVHCGLGYYSEYTWEKIGIKILRCIENSIQGLRYGPKPEDSEVYARYSSFSDVYAWYQSTQTYKQKQIYQQEQFFKAFDKELADCWIAYMGLVCIEHKNAKKLYKLFTAMETVLTHCPHVLNGHNPIAYDYFPQLVLETFRDSSKRYQFLDELTPEERLRWDIYIRAWYLGDFFNIGRDLAIHVFGAFIPAFCEDYLGTRQFLNCVQNLICDKYRITRGLR